jgi:GPH family glycoside/pentoside/hexuronide:cation symporter
MMPNDNSPSPAKTVPVWEKGVLGLGTLAGFFGFAGISILAYPIYNMVLGLDAALVGLALMIPRLWDAMTDPIMGRISDNCHSKWGRRRPFIVAGSLFMGLVFAVTWMVPEGWSDQSKMIYLIGMQLVFFTCYTIFAVPYTALTYEMTPDYNERTVVMSFCAFFHKLGELASGWMLPFAGFLSVVLVAGASDLNRSGIIAMGVFVGIFLLAVPGMLAGLFVKERFKHNVVEGEKVEIFKGIKDAIKNRAFVILVGIIILNTLSGIIASGIDQYLLVYYMHGGEKAMGLMQKGLLTTGYAVVGFASIPVISWLSSRFDKKGALVFVYCLMMAGAVAKWFVFQPGHPLIDLGFVQLSPVLLIDPLLCGPMWVAVKILLASMMADICDSDELQHGSRREGMFGAVFSWLEKMIVSLAFFGTGVALSLSGFAVDLGAEQSASTFLSMRLFLSFAPGLTALAALIVLHWYPINREVAAQTRMELEARRGAVSAQN